MEKCIRGKIKQKKKKIENVERNIRMDGWKQTERTEKGKGESFGNRISRKRSVSDGSAPVSEAPLMREDAIKVAATSRMELGMKLMFVFRYRERESEFIFTHILVLELLKPN